MKFNEKLKAAMQQLGLKQSQVVGMTGCSKGSISQYLSGKNTPSAEKQRDIAVSLGLAPDYFEHDTETEVVVPSPKQFNDNGVIQKLLVKDAAKMLGMNHKTVRDGLQQGVFPWGYAIHTSEHRWVYFINAKRFAEIEGIRLDISQFKGGCEQWQQK